MSVDSSVAVLGGGVIGASWTALFLAAGRKVRVYDMAEDAEERVRAYVAEAWPTLQKLGLAARGNPSALRFCATPSQAVDGAAFVQESVPERLPAKHALFREIEPELATDAVVASSASGLTLSQMQGGWADPAQFVLGHPFNPPHLIPLVEVMGNERTAPGVVDAAEAFYADVGKITIRVRREVPGHVANRLQAALWREAIHLVLSGVATVEDVDRAVWAGPGLRWAAMGPSMLFHLGAGAGGMAAFIERYAESFNGWWDDLGQPRLDAEVAREIVAGVDAEAAGASTEALAARRDRLITAMLGAAKAER